MPKSVFKHPCKGCTFLTTILFEGNNYDAYMHTAPTEMGPSIDPYIHYHNNLIIRNCDYEGEYNEEVHGSAESAGYYMGGAFEDVPMVIAYRAAIAARLLEEPLDSVN